MANTLEILILAFTAAIAFMTGTVFLLSKCFFLARWRIGWLMMMANVFYETAYKKRFWSRWQVDAVLFPVATVSTGYVFGPWLGLLAAVLFGLVWVGASVVDIRVRSGALAFQDSALVEKVPLPIPRLALVYRGPFLGRGRVLDLGVWPVGRHERIELLVLNPSTVEPQLQTSLSVDSDSDTVEITPCEQQVRCPSPGEVEVVGFTIRAAKPGKGARLSVTLRHGNCVDSRTIAIDRIDAQSTVRPVDAGISRWKGGCRAAFAWRGDQDLYDPATFQSAEGLRIALGLSRRFRLPSTLFLSGRLSLIEEEHRAFCEHFGWDRRSEEVPGFVDFLREEVDLKQTFEFPLESDRELAMEIGNHMYLHLGTHAAADPGNGWKQFSWIGEGEYPWHTGQSGDSFSEQRDNALKNAEVIREHLGFEVSSWGVPGRVYDENTPQAVEAAGIEIGTDTNASAFTNVLRLVPPHHPDGCERLVEITKKYPGDPDNAYKLAMLKYWLHAARRAQGTFLFMAHHHLLLYEGWSCYHITEEFFRHVLADCDGDFYVATVTALGRYWRDVLSPKTRVVEVRIDRERVVVANSGHRDLHGLPVEIELETGGSFMVLADVEAGQEAVVWEPHDRDNSNAGNTAS